MSSNCPNGEREIFGVLKLPRPREGRVVEIKGGSGNNCPDDCDFGVVPPKMDFTEYGLLRVVFYPPFNNIPSVTLGKNIFCSLSLDLFSAVSTFKDFFILNSNSNEEVFGVKETLLLFLTDYDEFELEEGCEIRISFHAIACN